MTLILVIEDEEQIRLNIQEILVLADFSVVTSSDGVRGLNLAKVKLPNLIICDIMMPGMDGLEVLQNLRNDPQTANIPLIFLTAKSERDDLRQGMNLGADDYITKPFEPREILQAVKARLERQAVSTQQYLNEQDKVAKIQQKIKESGTNLEVYQQLSQMRENILDQLSQDLRNPLSSINMALHMLKECKVEEQGQRYLDIIQHEYAREVKLLNEVDNLRELLTDDNTKLLKQFNLLNSLNLNND
ncbi:response regulator [Nodularia spumigena CS-584]|jgi:two-component system, OmpR family, alkaline phosphatase synthesis response regulator PhoP|uniref:histidine kinase n=1 Tax=Nodularia spumigena UHCC 0060 TaxID=3110300 RepID=A0ABU5UM35_NODSP|nr:response regulator [Nodularia spumigena]AHJ26522.1 transcriptional regulator [Nodularia spumigena CCY9414]EAW47082.1 Putative diguanylate phosphodiesterase (EAL domain) with Response Regulator Receiver modulation [Nodularia spumigena CCY9414]MDB9383058.1 response regulator [Nodularia spumigena CS-584]MEA5526530.1 response regulator [Nodularia spumigena UHCC 0143]MEA5556332.1 response regulator [Nodularia spumigena CH309]